LTTLALAVPDTIGDLKFKMSHMWQGWFICRRLGLAMVNLYVSNLKSLDPPIMKTAKAKHNIENWLAWST